ncbi:MAG: substrate-binding domain-containing protein [Acetobacteraceae bacterium]|nr:substrate-binding domain-containing protein [Acetobacteraceae bacterium]
MKGEPWLRGVGFAAVLLLGAASGPARAADPLVVYGAGSLRSVFDELLTAFGAPPGGASRPTYAPAGLLRARLEGGETADLFASADLAQPERLAAAGRGSPVVMFARNRMCALARRGVGLNPANLVDRLLDPAVKVATSTPGADPGGDYAWMIFDRIDRLRPGAGNALRGKAKQLVGGPSMGPPVATESVFLSNRADVMLGYCSGAPSLKRLVPDIQAVPMPPGLDPEPAFGLTVLSGNPLAFRFALFVMSQPGQTILEEYGFIPVALPDATRSP